MATRKTKARNSKPRGAASRPTGSRSALERATQKRAATKKRAVKKRPKKTGQEQPDLQDLTVQLRDRFHSRLPTNYLRGKDRLRDELMEILSCSPARAEHIVDSMVARGFARFGRHPRFENDPRFGIWHLDPSP